MQTEKFARIFKIAAAVIIFLSLDQNIEKTAVRAAIRPRITSAATETPIPMTSIQDSQKNAPTTRMVIDRFNEAFNRHDADALAAVLTDDTVFEDTSPAPDGRRVEGKAAVVDFWRTWFAEC